VRSARLNGPTDKPPINLIQCESGALFSTRSCFFFDLRSLARNTRRHMFFVVWKSQLFSPLFTEIKVIVLEAPNLVILSSDSRIESTVFGAWKDSASFGLNAYGNGVLRWSRRIHSSKAFSKSELYRFVESLIKLAQKTIYINPSVSN